jgi:hypothetical protein
MGSQADRRSETHRQKVLIAAEGRIASAHPIAPALQAGEMTIDFMKKKSGRV